MSIRDRGKSAQAIADVQASVQQIETNNLPGLRSLDQRLLAVERSSRVTINDVDAAVRPVKTDLLNRITSLESRLDEQSKMFDQVVNLLKTISTRQTKLLE